MPTASRAEQAAFLESLGTADVEHTGGDFLHHLCAVHDLLAAHGADAELAAAGMFHSIYGTERFQGFSLPLDQRGRVRQLIGERAERITWVNCVMDRASFDNAVAQALEGADPLADSLIVRDREGAAIPMSAEQLHDLAHIHLFDWLEQVERSAHEQPGGWNYRRNAYQQMAALVGEPAQSLYAATFAREPSRPS